MWEDAVVVRTDSIRNSLLLILVTFTNLPDAGSRGGRPAAGEELEGLG